jgi:hypothetical protein
MPNFTFQNANFENVGCLEFEIWNIKSFSWAKGRRGLDYMVKFNCH